jgi:enterobactin synthetase component D
VLLTPDNANNKHLFTKPLHIEKISDTTNTSCFICRFDPYYYTADLFQHYKIHFPSSIESSVNKRQAEYLAGRRCAQLALRAHGYDGFPVLSGEKREPIWPYGLVGSITHSNKYAAALICESKRFSGVGIDIEKLVGDTSRNAIIHQVVSRNELDYLHSIITPRITIDHLLTLIFSCKESFFKAAFNQTRRYFDFNAVQITKIDQKNGSITFRTEEQLCAELPAGLIFQADYQFFENTSVFTRVFI